MAESTKLGWQEAATEMLGLTKQHPEWTWEEFLTACFVYCATHAGDRSEFRSKDRRIVYFLTTILDELTTLEDRGLTPIEAVERIEKSLTKYTTQSEEGETFQMRRGINVAVLGPIEMTPSQLAELFARLRRATGNDDTLDDNPTNPPLPGGSRIQ